MFLQATHRTRYEYRYPSVDSHNEVRLMPITGPTQRCISFSLDVHPGAPVFSYEDVGGVVHHFGIREPHLSLEIVANAIVETFDVNPFSALNLVAPDGDFYSLSTTKDAWAEFLSPSPYVRLVPEAAQIARRVHRSGNGAVARFLIDLNRHLFELLDYDPGATDVHSTVEEVLIGRAGVCQDFAHLMVACCRSEGVPARYVSGYLYGGEGLRGELGTHAWVEALLPDGRWLALDPTNDLLANDHYIRVHVGRDYSDVPPTRGIYVGSPATKMEFGVTVVEARDLRGTENLAANC
jgi:transglutaminase-like putative cysteine protease